MNEEKLKTLSKWRDELEEKKGHLDKQRIEIEHKISKINKELPQIYSLLGEKIININIENNPYRYVTQSERVLNICKKEFMSEFTVKSLLIIIQNSNDENMRESRLSAILGNLSKENEIKLISRGKARMPSVYSNV